jgi:methyl-accepting chemotaxis protein
MNTQSIRRSRKLIQPGLQLRLIFSFVGLAGLALLGQFLLLGYRLSEAATGEGALEAEVPRAMLEVLTFSLVILLPVIGAIGVLLTFRIAGPVYRFEQFLASVASGEQIGPCKLRDGDELQSLCDAINAATESVRRRSLETSAPEAPALERQAG